MKTTCMLTASLVFLVTLLCAQQGVAGNAMFHADSGAKFSIPKKILSEN